MNQIVIHNTPDSDKIIYQQICNKHSDIWLFKYHVSTRIRHTFKASTRTWCTKFGPGTFYVHFSIPKREQFFIQWNQWSFTIASIYRFFPKFNKCLNSKSQEAKYDALTYFNFWLRYFVDTICDFSSLCF